MHAKETIETDVKIPMGISSPLPLSPNTYNSNNPIATANGYIGHVYSAKCQLVSVSKKNNNPIVVKIPPGTNNPGDLLDEKYAKLKHKPGIKTNIGHNLSILKSCILSNRDINNNIPIIIKKNPQKLFLLLILLSPLFLR